MLLKYSVYFILSLLLLSMIVVIVQMRSNRVPEASYKIVLIDGPIEIRQYPELIIAQVEVSGERYDAINTGFRLLAHYIFGGNQIDQKIAMTAPVIQEKVHITMTAPVTQEKINDYWAVRFIMPLEYTLQTLPKPDNPAISLLTVPSKKYIVIRFSGLNSDPNIDEHLKQLLAYVAQHKVHSVGDPIMAFYNPPWILPFLRRNEIMIEVN